MGANCAGRHVCEPPDYPDILGLTWTCDDCGRTYHSFDVRAEFSKRPNAELYLRTVPEGTLGWTTSKPKETP